MNVQREFNERYYRITQATAQAQPQSITDYTGDYTDETKRNGSSMAMHLAIMIPYRHYCN